MHTKRFKKYSMLLYQSQSKNLKYNIMLPHNLFTHSTFHVSIYIYIYIYIYKCARACVCVSECVRGLFYKECEFYNITTPICYFSIKSQFFETYFPNRTKIFQNRNILTGFLTICFRNSLLHYLKTLFQVEIL